jgi:hypothetical protein
MSPQKEIKRDDAPYYMPDEVVFGIEVSSPPSVWWGKSKFPDKHSFVTYLDGKGLLPLRGSEGFEFAQGPYQLALPIPGKPDKSTVLVTIRLNNPGNDRYLLYNYIKRVFEQVKKEYVNPPDADALVVVSPNWRSDHVQQHGPVGGPGKPPVAVNTPNPQDPFSSPAVDSALIGLPAVASGAGQIDVYVLDTIPPYTDLPPDLLGQPMRTLQDQIVDKTQFNQSVLGGLIQGGLAPGPAQSWQTNNKAELTLLTFTWAADVCPDAFAKDFEPQPNNTTPKYYETYHNPKHYVLTPVSDHGTFIANIILQIAPKAHVHLIEVLDTYGVGSVDSIAMGFERIARDRERDGSPDVTTPYLVNCSLVFMAPVLDQTVPGSASYNAWLQNDPCGPLVSDPQFQTVVRRLFESIVPSNNLLDPRLPANKLDAEEECLIIAAAGNESNSNGRFDALYPANAEAVLGVGALEKDANGKYFVADYSNYSDTPITAGIATLGAVQSIYTQEFPLDPDAVTTPQTQTQNQDGFAVWEGTSFATGVMTGYVAKVCLAMSQHPRQAVKWLYGHTTAGKKGEAYLEVTQP